MLKLATLYILTYVEFDVFATIIKNLKTPSSLVFTMAQYIKQKTFRGFKSQDYHVLNATKFTTSIEGIFRSLTSNGNHENFKSILEDMQQGVESS